MGGLLWTLVADLGCTGNFPQLSGLCDFGCCCGIYPSGGSRRLDRLGVHVCSFVSVMGEFVCLVCVGGALTGLLATVLELVLSADPYSTLHVHDSSDRRVYRQ